jgi:hypothetical protein
LRGRGCALVAVLAASPLVAGTAYDTPSGQPVTLEEVLLDENPGALWVRFRFLAPQISGGADLDSAVQDMQALCDQVAVPYVAEYALEPDRVVVSLSDRIVPFGEANAEVTQFFELYSLQDGACIWEEF